MLSAGGNTSNSRDNPHILIQNVTIVRLSRLSHGDNRRQYLQFKYRLYREITYNMNNCHRLSVCHFASRVVSDNRILPYGRRVWGSNAPHRKSVPPAGSTNTNRNLLQVTPPVLLQPAGGTRSTFTSRGPYPPYTFTSCGLHPPYCCFVLVVPVALSCLSAADTSSKLLPRAVPQISIQKCMNL